MLSYEKIISINKDFADNHYVIKNFGNGERWQINDHDQDPTFKYPLMYIEDLPFPVGNKQLQYSLRVWFVTRIEAPEDRGNELLYSEYAQAKSAMVQCATDLIAFWVQDTNYPTLDIEKSLNIQTFIDRGEDKFTGCYVDIKFKEVFNYDNCIIPMAGVPAPDEEEVVITINSDSFITLDCDTTYNIVVKDTDGTIVGSKVGSEWIVPAAGGDPVTQTLNNGTISLTDTPSGENVDYQLLNSEDLEIAPTVDTDTANNKILYFDNPLENLNGSPIDGPLVGNVTPKEIETVDTDGTVLSPTVITNNQQTLRLEFAKEVTDISYVRTAWTARNTNFNTHDLGWYLANEPAVFDYNVNGITPILDLSDSTKLLTNNAFGNLNRVTNSLGLTATYNGTGGELADYAIDHFTGQGYYLRNAVTTNVNFVNSATTLRAATLASFSDWRMLTMMDIALIVQDDAASPSTIFSAIENWSTDLTWVMNSAGTGTGYFWRLNQHLGSSLFMNTRSITSPNASIMTIATRNHY